MTLGLISTRIVSERLRWVEDMLRALPLDDRQAFLSNRRNVWAAEACLHRALEAFLDLGRHILAKGFGIGVGEYKEISTCLKGKGVISS